MKTKPAIVMENPAGRRVVEDLRHPSIRPAVEDPVVADLEIAARPDRGSKLDANPVLDVNGSGGHVQESVGIHVLRLIPTVHSGVARGVGSVEIHRARNGRGEGQDAVGVVDDRDLRQVACQALELAEIIRNFNPVADLKAQNLITANLLNCHLSRRWDYGDAGRDGGVVPGPFELGGGAVTDRTSGVDFDAIQSVLQASIAAAGGDDAGSSLAGARRLKS